jgi:hypothetical protein
MLDWILVFYFAFAEKVIALLGLENYVETKVSNHIKLNNIHIIKYS